MFSIFVAFVIFALCIILVPVYLRDRKIFALAGDIASTILVERSRIEETSEHIIIHIDENDALSMSAVELLEELGVVSRLGPTTFFFKKEVEE